MLENNCVEEGENSNLKKKNKTFYLKGINLAKLLNSYNKKMEKVLKLFKTFDSTYSSIINQIENEIENKNPKNARMLLHRLEGAAAIICAEGVQIAAFDLREAIKSGNEDLKSYLACLDHQLIVVLNSIRSIDLLPLEN